MFQWLNKQGVRSSKGFVLQSVDRYGYHYIEGERTLRVDVEPLRDSQGTYYEVVSEGSFHNWLHPHESEIIEIADMQRLKMNVDDTLTFMQINHQFQ